MDARSSANRQGLPPALPAKVHRNRYARGSSSSSSLDMDTEGSPRSPLSPPLALSLREEPSLPTDCHTHSFHSSSSQWQERIRADATPDRPPPLPRKLFRARSLPVMTAQRQSPHPPRPPQPCDGSARGDPSAVPSPCGPNNKAEKGNIILRGSYSTPSSPLCPPSEPVLSLTSLNFDTPDYMLPYYFKDLSSQEQVSWTIQQRHLLFLLETAQRLEAELVGSPLEERQQEAGPNEREAGSLHPEDFTLCEGRQPRCQIGGAVYYAVRCATVPGKVFAAKDCLCLRYLAQCRTEEVLYSAALLGLLLPAGE
nr:PREDICTED: uncharacterized protein LOC107079644 [Lepisosteus oculatus]